MSTNQRIPSINTHDIHDSVQVPLQSILCSRLHYHLHAVAYNEARMDTLTLTDIRFGGHTALKNNNKQQNQTTQFEFAAAGTTTTMGMGFGAGTIGMGAGMGVGTMGVGGVGTEYETFESMTVVDGEYR